MESQFQGGVASQRPAHEEKGPAVARRANSFEKEVENRVGIGSHGGERRAATTEAIAAIVGHKQANALPIVERRNPIMVANHLTVAVKV